MIDKPSPSPTWTAWPAIADGGVHMARVRLDVGQYSFTAGSQYDPTVPRDFCDKVRNVMWAVTGHAIEKGWLPPPLPSTPRSAK